MSCIFEAVEKNQECNYEMRKSNFISVFCLTGKSDGGKFTLRAVTADPISDTNPISQKKETNPIFLKKEANPI